MNSALIVEVNCDEIGFQEDLSAVNFDVLCRICGNCTDQLMPILDNDANEHGLLQKINEHLPILKVIETDVLPMNICYQCASVILSWNELYHTSIQVDERLRNTCSKVFSYKSAFNNTVLLKKKTDSVAQHAENIINDNDEDIRAVEIFIPHLPDEQLQVVNTSEDELMKKHLDPNPTIAALKDNISNHVQDDGTTSFLSSENLKNENLELHSGKCALCDAEITESNSVLFNESIFCFNCYAEINAIGHLPPILTNNNNSSCHDTNEFLSDFDTQEVCGENTITNPQTASNLETELESRESSNPKKIESMQCATCQKVFLRKGSLIAHLKNHEKLTCKICGVVYKTLMSFKTHKKRHVRKSVNSSTLIYCDVCKKYFKTIKGLTYHREKICIQYKCYVCDENFVTHQMLQDHVKRKHDVQDKPRIPKESKIKPQENETLMVACHICGKVIAYSTMARHLVLHTEAKPFTCHLCGKQFKRKHSLQDHIMIEMGMKNYVCDICGAKFLKQGYLNKHLKYHKLNNGEYHGFECELCGKKFPEKWRLGVHQRAVHKGGESASLFCDICGEQFTERWMVRKHKHAEHNGTEFEEYECDICGKKFLEKWLLKSHQRRAHKDKSQKRHCELCGKQEHRTSECIHRNLLSEAKCEHCKKSFPSEILLKEHLVTDHESDKKLDSVDSEFQFELNINEQKTVLHVCKNCGQIFSDTTSLKAHVLKNLCRNESTFECSECERSFTSKYSLTNHMMAHQKAHTIHTFKCDECQKDFLTEEALKNHLSLDKVCLLCQNVYLCNEQLRKHVFTEHEYDDDDVNPNEKDQVFKCKLCNKTFTRKQTMKTHLFAEMNLRRYMCEFCDKSYNYFSHLMEHLATNHGKKQHVCSFCGKDFPTLKRFRDHVSLHSEEKPFHCDCGSSFKLNRYLTKHKKHCKLKTVAVFDSADYVFKIEN